VPTGRKDGLTLSTYLQGMAEFVYDDGLKLRLKVRAVITNDAGDVLLVRPHGYAENDWTFAGGGVEAGESPVQAMRREIAEELGIESADELEQLPVTNRFVYSSEHKRKRELDHDGQEAVMFFARLPAGCALRVQEEEIAGVRWFARSEAGKAFPVEKQRAIYEACMASIEARSYGCSRRAA
jgi:8-oxo-dGTP pyrophosphatase MutT (NUDIX family)